jgi:subtilisin family serine protease
MRNRQRYITAHLFLPTFSMRFLVLAVCMLIHDGTLGAPGQSTPTTSSNQVTNPTLKLNDKPNPLKVDANVKAPTVTTKKAAGPVPIAQAAVPFTPDVDDDVFISPDTFIVHILRAKGKLPDAATFASKYLPGCKITEFDTLPAFSSVSFRVVGACTVAKQDGIVLYHDLGTGKQASKQRLQRRGEFQSLFPLAETGLSGDLVVKDGLSKFTSVDTKTIKDAYPTLKVNGITLDGTGVNIGVVDSGYDLNHYAFHGTTFSKLYTLKKGDDMVKAVEVNKNTMPKSRNGHGTKVLSVLAGQWSSASSPDTYQGIAPKSVYFYG